MQSTGQASTQAVSFVPMQGSAITYAIAVYSQVPIHSTKGGRITIRAGTFLPTRLFGRQTVGDGDSIARNCSHERAIDDPFWRASVSLFNSARSIRPPCR